MVHNMKISMAGPTTTSTEWLINDYPKLQKRPSRRPPNDGLKASHRSDNIDYSFEKTRPCLKITKRNKFRLFGSNGNTRPVHSKIGEYTRTVWIFTKMQIPHIWFFKWPPEVLRSDFAEKHLIPDKLKFVVLRAPVMTDLQQVLQRW